MSENSATRLVSFIKEQRKYWMKLYKGIVPNANIIEGWIESCDFALEDLDVLCKQALKG